MIRRSAGPWIGSIAGVIDEADYPAMLVKAGFEAIAREPTRVYRLEDAKEFLAAPASRRRRSRPAGRERS